MNSMRRMITIFIIAALLCSLHCSASAVSAPGINAAAVVLADMDSGVILYEKNMNKMRSPASLTKIMTGLLAVEAIERGDIALDDIITAPGSCWQGMDADSSNAEISPGEQMPFKDYLYAAMVKSANEACNVIAVAIDGSIQAFVNRMNLRANELGAHHTYFSDTNGLSNENHYTTAHDLFLITSEAMKHEIFVDAVNTIDYEIEETNMHAKRYLNSSNALLCQDGLYGDGYLYLPASGVKTGYTYAAGYCLVSTAEKNGMRLLCVVLGCNGPLNTGDEGFGNFASTIRLYDWAFSNFEKHVIIERGEIVNRAPVQLSKDKSTVSLRSAETVELLLPKDCSDSDIRIDISTDGSRLIAPISRGTALGTASVYVYGQKYAKVKLYTAEEIEADTTQLILSKVGILWANSRIRTGIIAAGVLLLAIVIILIRYSIEKRRHLMEIADAEERRYNEREREMNQAKSRQAQEDMQKFRSDNGGNNDGT